ncbi:LysR substrate-binding domain-containing protein [Delftia sp. PS-11]|uniref:LysR substrate-binding domain-containing protein n=1 Tax=Delftia sp. PS-11 TaxID=2767222 RepID=UPI0024544332|nr:LysR substrate-binding domain-containing protein [Delftia sp. PS-11]KAJ8745019.1 LysR family transcriptional regulator [Delftia sp. PS-11]
MNLLTSMRYLVALNAHRHFGRAALACHITQPALSNALRALEQEFGTVIVRRGRVFAGFTPEGEQVLATALAMLRAEESLRQDLSAGAGVLRGQLRMAAVPTAMPMLTRFACLLRERHPGITPVVLSMSSAEIESGLDDLSLDLALGYSARMPARGPRLQSWPQYQEHYYLLCRDPRGADQPLAFGADIGWREVASLPLCLLTPDMHNRTVIDEAFAAVQASVQPAMETNSVLALVMAVAQSGPEDGSGGMATVLPGAMVATVRHMPGLLARPLRSPELLTPIGFMAQQGAAYTRALQAALLLQEDAQWRAQCLRHAGALAG